jgi:transposase-like protein
MSEDAAEEYGSDEDLPRPQLLDKGGLELYAEQTLDTSPVIERPVVQNPHRKAYTKEFQLQALAKLEQNGGNVRRTARELGIIQQTLRRWALDAGKARTKSDHYADAKGRSAKEKFGLADSFERVALKCLRRVGIKLDTATAIELMRGAAICAEKMQDLRRQATSLSGNLPLAHLTDDEMDAKLQKAIGAAERIKGILEGKPQVIVQQIVEEKAERKADLEP